MSINSGNFQPIMALMKEEKKCPAVIAVHVFSFLLHLTSLKAQRCTSLNPLQFLILILSLKKLPNNRTSVASLLVMAHIHPLPQRTKKIKLRCKKICNIKEPFFTGSFNEQGKSTAVLLRVIFCI